MAGGVALALLGGAGGTVYALTAGGGDDQPVSGPAAQRAAAAAAASVPGGRALGVERDDGGAAYEVEVRRPDGVVEVHVDSAGRVVGSAFDDGDTGGDRDGAGDD